MFFKKYCEGDRNVSVSAIGIDCPSCGAAVGIRQDVCEFCERPVIVSTFNSVRDMPLPMLNKYAGAYRQLLEQSPSDRGINNAIAMCYLKLGLHYKASEAFEKAMNGNFDSSETFFYAAVCLLGGKKAFLAERSIINKVEEYINAALLIEPKGIYYYFLAYIKYDYFYRKYFNTSPTYLEALRMSHDAGVAVSDFDIEQLYAILCVSRPAAL